jgi:positive regulator of sigma E activity
LAEVAGARRPSDMDKHDQHRPAAAGGEGPPQTTCEGRVVAVRGDVVTVAVKSLAECEFCASKEGCHIASLGNKQVEVAARGFKVGDRVRLITFSRAVLRASIVLYLIPALLVVVGSFAGYATVEAFTSLDGNIGSFIGVVVGLLCSLLFVHFYKVATGDRSLEIRLEKIN